MNGFLLDTNALSEFRRERPDRGLMLWVDAIDDHRLFVSVLTLGEIRLGIARLERRDPGQAAGIEGWLHELSGSYADRVLDVDARVADTWGRIGARRPLPVVDGLLAATCLVHGLRLVSRNVSDFAGIEGLTLVNPFLR